MNQPNNSINLTCNFKNQKIRICSEFSLSTINGQLSRNVAKFHLQHYNVIREIPCIFFMTE